MLPFIEYNRLLYKFFGAVFEVNTTDRLTASIVNIAT